MSFRLIFYETKSFFEIISPLLSEPVQVKVAWY